MNRPLLLIDIDGVISLFGFDPGRPPAGTFVSVDGIAHFLSSVAAEQILALSDEFELAWCSGWEEKADEYLPFALGVPSGIPHVAMELQAGSERGAGNGDGSGGADARHWKLDAIDRFAGRRALAWIDDGHDLSCEHWAATRGAPTLLVTTEPAIGLTSCHTDTLTAWARALAA
jgi:hypothetical protein